MFERRRFPRANLPLEEPLPCQLCQVDHGPVFVGFVVDLSERGAAVRLEASAETGWEDGTEVFLRTQFPSSSGSCRFTCRVRHLRAGDEGQIVGLELTGAWSRSHFGTVLERLKRFLDRLRGRKSQSIEGE